MISHRRGMTSVFGASRNWACAAAMALAAILLLTPCAGAEDLPNQGAIDAALKQLTEAEQAANDSIPGNSRVKDAEDALDAATRANEETSSDNATAKAAAQTAEANARAAADTLRSDMADRTTEEQKARAAAYREALRKRREARQVLKTLLAELQNFLRGRRRGIGGSKDIEAAIIRLRGRIGRAASVVVFTPTQTGFVPPQGSPFANCSVGQAGCSFPASLATWFKPVFGRAAADSPAYCTYGTATPAPTMFTPSDEFGNPVQPPIEIGDTPRRAGGPQSAMNDPGNPQVQTGDDSNNTMDGTRGPDDIAGGKGKDEFWFTTSDNPNDPNTTLNDGDRISDYESDEGIVLTGTRLGSENVKVVYDPAKDETRLEIDFPDRVTGRPDGKPDKTLILSGDKRGTVKVETNCCSQPTTEIRITIPRQGSQPRQAGGQQTPTPVPQQSTPQSAPQSAPREATPTPQSTPRQATPAEPSAPEKQPGASAGDPNPGMTIASNPVTIHIKATEAVLEGEPTGTELRGEVVKLFAKQEPSLPGTGPATKTALDKGFDKPPVTCTTGADGRCKTQIAGEDREIYGFPATGSPHYRGDLALKKNNGAVIQKASGALTPAQHAALEDVPPGAQLVKSDFKIGNKTFTRIGVVATDAIAADFLAKHANTFGAAMQTDYCGEKKPGPPLGMEPVSYGALHSELPRQVITLRVALGGKRR